MDKTLKLKKMKKTALLLGMIWLVFMHLQALQLARV